MTTTVYGIKNCDTIKKALKWLDAEGKPYAFHDYRKDGINQEMLSTFVEKLGWEALLNKRGTTFRTLSDEQKNNLDESNAIALMLVYPAMIKRPLLVHGDTYHLGFKPAEYQAIFTE